MTKTLYYLLLISGLAPATLLLLLTLYGLGMQLAEGRFSLLDSAILLTGIAGVCGYLGLLALVFHKQAKYPLLVVVLLGLGIGAFVGFVSVEGGQRAWQWIVAVEDPVAWMLYVWPTVVTLIFLIRITRRLIRLRPVGGSGV